MDAIHPQHEHMMANGWIKRDRDFQICSNTGRQRFNINGAVCEDKMNLVM